MMDLHLNRSLANGYTSNTQVARVVTEDWLARNMFCPVCGASVLGHYRANKPVSDFFCNDCQSDFELKSKYSKTAVISPTIADGAFATMIERITSFRNPHLFVMTYADWVVNNLMLIPNYLFVPDVIERRKPLAETARRAGWVGCNIRIGDIPDSGKLFVVKKGVQEDKQKVLDQYQRLLALQTTKIERRGWMMDVLKCVERIPTDSFTIDQLYAFASELQKKHPTNNFVKEKIRQQLQCLRDKGFVEFIARGLYKKTQI